MPLLVRQMPLLIITNVPYIESANTFDSCANLTIPNLTNFASTPVAMQCLIWPHSRTVVGIPVAHSIRYAKALHCRGFCCLPRIMPRSQTRNPRILLPLQLEVSVLKWLSCWMTYREMPCNRAVQMCCWLYIALWSCYWLYYVCIHKIRHRAAKGIYRFKVNVQKLHKGYISLYYSGVAIL